MTQPQRYLNDDLTRKILTRLPLKSVVRFKSVSKSWNSTLSSSDFAMAHLTKSGLSHPCAPVNNLLIQCERTFYVYTSDDVDVDDDDSHGNKLIKLDVGFATQGFELAGSCNGLICLRALSYEYFILWNPVTRKVQKYDADDHGKALSRAMSGPYSVACGFGYSILADDFKYVRIMSSFGNKRKDGCNIIIRVFSLREKMWRTIYFDIATELDPLSINGKGYLVNQKLYWNAFSYSAAGFLVIVSFDLGLERFDILPHKSVYIHGVMGQCLCINLGLIDVEKPIEILKFDTLPVKDLMLTGSYDMVGFTRTGKFFVTRFSNSNRGASFCTTLNVVDTSRESVVQCSMLYKFETSISTERYVPSLISPCPFVDSEA